LAVLKFLSQEGQIRLDTSFSIRTSSLFKRLMTKSILRNSDIILAYSRVLGTPSHIMPL